MTPLYLFLAALAATSALAWLRVPCALAYAPLVAFGAVALWQEGRG